MSSNGSKNSGGNANLKRATPPTSYDVLDTPGTNSLCGFYAVISSLEAQMPDLKRPTVEDLLKVYNTSEMAELNAAMGQTNTNYFSADQVAGTVYAWGNTCGINLQLGCLVEGGAPLLLPTPTSDAADVRVLWIYNDNADVLQKTGLNHFSGLRIQ